MKFDALRYRYPSKRHLVYGKNGMVATSQPLAAQAGLEILRRGGNAVDAAVATAACLTVVEPTSNGLGSDCFALVWAEGKLHGLNGSGPAPMALTADEVRRAGFSEMPRHGFLPVTVPGAVGGWKALSERFGALDFAELMKPAAAHAEGGYPVSPGLVVPWARTREVYAAYGEREDLKPWFDTFAANGRTPQAGDIQKLPCHAETLRLIGETGGDAFYKGTIAEAIDAFSAKMGGFLRKSDLAAYSPEWVEPIGVNYRGYGIWEIPPNGQGLVALIALNILSGFDFSQMDDAQAHHVRIEALKLAFADGRKYITDSRKMRVPVEKLLSAGYAAERRALIGDRSLLPEPGVPDRSGTVYLAAADCHGNMVSFIQSNYMGFGSGIVVPGTGIALQNRGHGFSLDPEHHNYLEPGKRTFHTIIPGFITKDGAPIGPFGVMGGAMQPQGHLQVAANLIDCGLNPQEALDAPRWQWMEGREISVEMGFPADTARALTRMGHKISAEPDEGSFGRGQIIMRSGDSLVGATEPRTDGYVAVY